MKKLLYLFLTVLIVGCSGEDSNNQDNNPNDGDNTLLICNGDNPVYLADNGITIKACDFASVGDTGVINGITYTVVDEAMLREMIADEADVTKAVTTKVTDMSRLFYDTETQTPTDFNQPIGNWDTSNVTNMSYVFTLTNFNQNISSWDVSNVTNMELMFYSSNFNKDISSWDVSNVINMQGIFGFGDFNQPIGNWDVSNVTNMDGALGSGVFNQPIGNWDVSNVIYMRAMFSQGVFNQNINNWNIGNVTDLQGMFYFAKAFNQDLSNWDISSVEWCQQFNVGTPQWTLPKPNLPQGCLK